MKEKAGGLENQDFNKEIQTLKKKIEILEQAFVSSAGAYYNINLTKNYVPGIMYQMIDEEQYSINEKTGLPADAPFSDVITYWGEQVPKEEKKAFYEFFNISNLLKRFENGEHHVTHKYWTRTALHETMLAEQHIIMYADEENGDVLAITYVFDLTEQYRKEKQIKKEQEKNYKELENALLTAQHANHAKTTFLNNSTFPPVKLA